MTTDATWFGEVRALAQRPADPRSWTELLALAHRALRDAGPEALRDIYLPYLLDAARRWPDAARLAPAKWHTWTMSDPSWSIMPLARAVHLDEQTGLSARTIPRRALLLSRLDATTHLHISHAPTAHALRDATLPASIRHLTLTLGSSDDLLQSLGTPEWLAQITHLRLTKSWGAPPSVPDALRLPGLRWLETPAAMLPDALDLGPLVELALNQDLTHDALAALLDHPRAPHLTTLRLDRPNCDRPTLEALVSAATLTRLARLDLQTMPLWEQAADGLGRHMRLPALRHLGLHTCHLGDEELLALLGHSTLTGLDTLDLRGNRLGADGVALLKEALPNTRVELEGNWIEDATRGAPYALHLHGNRLPPTAIEQIARTVIAAPHLLTHMTLRAIQLGDRDLSPLLSLHLPALTHLDVGENILRPHQIIDLLDHDRWPAITHLDLSKNPLHSGLDPLLAALRARGITSLILRTCMLGQEQLDALRRALAAGWRPALIDLSGNFVTADAIDALRLAAPDTTIRDEGTLSAAFHDMAARGDHTLTLNPALLDQLAHHVTPRALTGWAKLRHLRITDSPAAAISPRLLLHALRGLEGGATPDLIELTIQGHARLNEDEMGRLTDALTRTLQILRITHNATNARTATHLLRQLRQPHLTTLDLRHNGLQDAEPLRILARNRDLPRLTLLQLREGNLLSHDDLRALERRMPHVTVI
jgi:hypothetical protein